MGILQNYKEGNMYGLRSINYSETGTQPPYVIKDIKDPPNNNDKTIGLQFNKRIDDTARIAQMLVKKPGLKWIGNQALLDNANLQRKAKAAADKKRGQQGGATNAGVALAAAGAAAAQVAKVVGSTLAQVPVNGTGTHFVRGFTPDTYLKQGDPKGILGFLGFDSENGASKALQGQTIITDNEGQSGYTPPVDPSPLEINFLTGGGSSFQSPLELSNLDLLDPLKISVGKKTTEQENSIFTDTERTTQLIDYRKLKNKGYRSNTYSLDYSDSKIKKETKVGLGDQGIKKKITSTYSDTDPSSIDTINAKDILITNTLSSDSVLTEEKIEQKDFIKFRFEVITPEDTTLLFFRAFLTQFDDSYQGSWDSTKYLGRAENFYTYQGFERSINIGFNIAAATRAEMKPLYRKMAALASVTAPTYGNDGRFMRGTIAKVTVGDYIYEVPGIIESVNYTWNTNYNWEIALQKDSMDNDMQELPQIMAKKQLM